MALRVESALISFHLHATEDPEKVMKSIEKILGVQQAAFNIQKLEGHFGNEIASYTAQLEGMQAQGLFELVVKSLPQIDKHELLASFEGRVERNIFLYLRLDKQKLVLGRIELGESDPIKLRFRFPKTPPLELDSFRVMLT
ncbi:MAG: hypothetical protein JRN68_04325 [Nitrososphaerota archaeon]|jgi:RNA binding exosome subunit|nr:hypothetical protein [Nitrososphaerota archaeon]